MNENSPKRRGRPPAYDRDEALAGAGDAFWRGSYAATTLDDLTAATGMNRPSLYAAFGDKQRLFDEASSVYFERTIEAVDSATTVPVAREAIARMLTETAHAHTGAATPPGCLMLTEPRLHAQREVLRRRLEDRLDRGVRDGDLPPSTDTGHLASFLVAVLRGMSGCARDGGTTEDLLGIAETAMAALPTVPRPARGPRKQAASHGE